MPNKKHMGTKNKKHMPCCIESTTCEAIQKLLTKLLYFSIIWPRFHLFPVDVGKVSDLGVRVLQRGEDFAQQSPRKDEEKAEEEEFYVLQLLGPCERVLKVG